jgi:DNA-binding GntR family transcriptional regulator
MPVSIPSTSEEASRAPHRPGTKRALNGAGGSLHGEILAKLRDFLVEGGLAAGARVPERQLCEMFGISRTPLREALKVLAAEGLVDLLPNRGARVRVLSEQDIHELFDLMAGLEALAGRLACEAITEPEIVEIEALHHDMYVAYMHRDMHGYFQTNQLIHKKIVDAARNHALSSAYAGYAGRIRRIRYAANLARKRDRWGEAMREHEAILDALRRRAGLELSDILFTHLRNKQAAAIEQLAESQPAASEQARHDGESSDPQDFAWLSDH